MVTRTVTVRSTSSALGGLDCPEPTQWQCRRTTHKSPQSSTAATAAWCDGRSPSPTTQGTKVVERTTNDESPAHTLSPKFGERVTKPRTSHVGETTQRVAQALRRNASRYCGSRYWPTARSTAAQYGVTYAVTSSATCRNGWCNSEGGTIPVTMNGLVNAMWRCRGGCGLPSATPLDPLPIKLPPPNAISPKSGWSEGSLRTPGWSPSRTEGRLPTQGSAR